MTRGTILLSSVISAVALTGCVAGMVAGAAGTAIQATQGKAESNAHLQPAAKAACDAYAARYGSVHIIDVEQHSADKIIVWGTVEDGTQRRSFECGFKAEITYFKLREIRVRRAE